MRFINISKNVFDYSLVISKKINKILEKNNYIINSYSDSLRFCIISCLFCYYFFEILLIKKYNYSKSEATYIVNNAIEVLCKSVDLGKKEINEHFNNLSKLLNNYEFNIDYDSFEFVASLFWVNATPFKNNDVETVLLLNIYKELNEILENKYKISK